VLQHATTMPRRASLITSCLFLALALSVPAPARAEDMAASLELHGGFFGLFNLNKEYTDADPAFGVTAAFEVDVHRYFALGLEYGLSWVKSARGQHHRLTMGPQLRVRFNVELEAGFSFYVIAAGGLAVWPGDDGEPELHPALLQTRVGWSMRITGGCEYALDPRVTIFLGLGYSATTTYGDALSATVDNMLVGVGSRVRF
jgi:hypothetical protein